MLFRDIHNLLFINREIYQEHQLYVKFIGVCVPLAPSVCGVPFLLDPSSRIRIRILCDDQSFIPENCGVLNFAEMRHNS